MKLLKRILFLLVITAAVYAGYWLKTQGTGFVLIQYQDFSIETSVFVFSLLLIIVYIVVTLFLRSTLGVIKLPNFIHKRYANYQSKKSSSGLIAGLTEFSEGRFKKAENFFVKQASDNKDSFLNYLLAARASQLLHAISRRDAYLKLAHEINPDADVAIGLTQAELQLSNQQNELALATLNQLIASHPKHDYVLRLMARAYLQLEDWSHLCPLLKDLRQSKLLPEEGLKKYERIAYNGYLQKSGASSDTSELTSIWQGMPKYLQQDLDFIALYVQQLSLHNEHIVAEKILRDELNKRWNEKLITLYSSFIHEIKADNNEKYFNTILQNCEKQLVNYPHNAALLLSAGKICVALQLWGKAKSYFETSLQSQPLAGTYLQLAQLLEQTGEIDEAQKYYQLGLKFCLSK